MPTPLDAEHPPESKGLGRLAAEAAAQTAFLVAALHFVLACKSRIAGHRTVDIPTAAQTAVYAAVLFVLLASFKATNERGRGLLGNVDMSKTLVVGTVIAIAGQATHVMIPER